MVQSDHPTDAPPDQLIPPTPSPPSPPGNTGEEWAPWVDPEPPRRPKRAPFWLSMLGIASMCVLLSWFAFGPGADTDIGYDVAAVLMALSALSFAAALVVGAYRIDPSLTDRQPLSALKRVSRVAMYTFAGALTLYALTYVFTIGVDEFPPDPAASTYSPPPPPDHTAFIDWVHPRLFAVTDDYDTGNQQWSRYRYDEARATFAEASRDAKSLSSQSSKAASTHHIPKDSPTLTPTLTLTLDALSALRESAQSQIDCLDNYQNAPGEAHDSSECRRAAHDEEVFFARLAEWDNMATRY